MDFESHAAFSRLCKSERAAIFRNAVAGESTTEAAAVRFSDLLNAVADESTATASDPLNDALLTTSVLAYAAALEEEAVQMPAPKQAADAWDGEFSPPPSMGLFLDPGLPIAPPDPRLSIAPFDPGLLADSAAFRWSVDNMGDCIGADVLNIAYRPVQQR
jgi:hypothetical protein